MSNLRKCKLCCVSNTYKPIKLPNNEPIIVGRTELTGIRDSALSRNQVKLLANVESCRVRVIPLGVNPSGANGYCLQRNTEYNLHHKDRLELLLDRFIYEVVFDPAPEFEIVDSKKRKFDGQVDDDQGDYNKKIKNDLKVQKSEWEEIDNKKLFIFTSAGLEPQDKIAAYDLDGTIIKTKSGARFPKNAVDWVFWSPEVPTVLRELHSKKYKIVIFTNQAGIGLGRSKITDFKPKIEAIFAKLEVPIQVFVSTGKGVYRKPAPGMWDAFTSQKNNGIPIDVNESFYCGDAAGRDKDWAPRKKKDHSIGDRLYALNIGLPFKTPEEHFLGARIVQHIMPEFDPKSVKDIPLFEPEDSLVTSTTQEVIVFVGSPGSGKSFICNSLFVPNGYLHVNRDKLGSWQSCVQTLETALKNKQSVVVDNTNPDLESRKRYLDVVKKMYVPCRCFLMNTTINQAKHNNIFRQMTDTNHQIVTDMIINSYNKKFQEPKIAEGFTEIVKVNCKPTFEDPEHERLYHMYLLEK